MTTTFKINLSYFNQHNLSLNNVNKTFPAYVLCLYPPPQQVWRYSSQPSYNFVLLR